MQHILEHIGVSIAAITGILAARGKQVDLFGVIVLALVTAVGGGTIRDLAIGDTPVFWARNPGFLINGSITAVVTFYLVRYRDLPSTVLMVADAFALALFTMVGTRKGLAFTGSAPIAVVMGVITGVAGGMLRDLLTGEIPLVFRPQIYLYATAAFFGASGFVLLDHFALDPKMNMIVGTVATLLLRLIGIRWRLRLPLYRPREVTTSNTTVPPPPQNST